MPNKHKPALRPSDDSLQRFRATFDAISAGPVGLAVSGGPDSVALLLLAAAVRPGVQVATVDHDLRPESRAEAEMVARLCADLEVPHQTLTIEWDEKPVTAIQERARTERYRLLANWAKKQGLSALATGHHLDDQAETVMMRLARGAGVRGLAAMRPKSSMAGLPVLRPLLGWTRADLERLCADAGVTPIADPSNEDDRFERVRVRRALADADWLDPQKIARSAAHLSRADAALRWATDLEWERSVEATADAVTYRLSDAPLDIRRRIARRSVLRLAKEGSGADLRGRELDRLLAALMSGKKATLRGVMCVGGPKEWRFIPAPNRSRPVESFR